MQELGRRVKILAASKQFKILLNRADYIHIGDVRSYTTIEFHCKILMKTHLKLLL